MLQCIVSSFYKIIDTICYLFYLATCCFCMCFNKSENEEENEDEQLKNNNDVI
jgi:hypothetical protein